MTFGSSRWTRTTSRGHEPRELPIAPPLRYNQGTLKLFYSQNRCIKRFAVFVPFVWSEWCESNTLRLVPKTSDLTDSLHPDMLVIIM